MQTEQNSSGPRRQFCLQASRIRNRAGGIKPIQYLITGVTKRSERCIFGEIVQMAHLPARLHDWSTAQDPLRRQIQRDMKYFARGPGPQSLEKSQIVRNMLKYIDAQKQIKRLLVHTQKIFTIKTEPIIGALAT